MRKIKFIDNPDPNQVEEKWHGKPPKAGDVYEFPDDEAARWVGYNKAEYLDKEERIPKPLTRVHERAAAEPAPEPEPAKAAQVKAQERDTPEPPKPAEKPVEAKPEPKAEPKVEKPAEKPTAAAKPAPHTFGAPKHGRR